MRVPRSWLRELTGSSYVQFGKRQINLGSVATTAKKKYEKLLQEHGFSEPNKDVSVRELVTLFLKWSKEEHESDTTDWYGRFPNDFVDQYGRLLVSQLKPYMVNNSCCREMWTQSTRRCGII